MPLRDDNRIVLLFTFGLIFWHIFFTISNDARRTDKFRSDAKVLYHNKSAQVYTLSEQLVSRQVSYVLIAQSNLCVSKLV